MKRNGKNGFLKSGMNNIRHQSRMQLFSVGISKDFLCI